MKRLPIIVFLFFATTHAIGWGQTGHRTVGLIAENHMSKKALKNIKKVLGNETIAMVGNWMDEIKSDNTYDYMGPWHYCTIPDGMTYEEAGTPEEGDVIIALESVISELKSKQFTDGDEISNLKILIHLLADIHQPMHVGNGTDRGGNDVRIDYFWQSSNLHRVWDTGIIEQQNLSYTEYATWIDFPTESQITTWQNSTVRDWAAESVTFREGIYDLPENKKLSYRYNYEHIKTLNLRLLQAGVRLAGILNDIYG